MSDPDSASGKPADNSNTTRKLVWAALVLGVAIAIFWATRDAHEGGGAGGGVSPQLGERLELNRIALAATENLEVSAADEAWSALREQLPGDASVALNLAITRVLRVDQLSAQATNASLDDAQKKGARTQLPDAISAARTAIDDYADIADDRVMPIWLRARVDLHEASLLPGSMTKSLRKRVYEQLAAALGGEAGKEPGAMILGGTLIQVIELLEDPIDGLPDDLLADAAKTVGALSDQHSDNLFFALRAARLNIATKNTQAARFVKRASELARAIEPSIRRETRPIGVTPDELVAQIIAAIESGNWSEAENRMLLWFNVLNSTEIVKTDRRRASPHPLDRLSFDSLRRLSSEAEESSPLPEGSAAIPLEPHPIGGAADVEAIASIDFDLDLDPDLVTADSEGVLRLWSNDGSGQFSAAGQLGLDIQPTGLIAADLFVVDSSNPGRLRADPVASDPAKPDYASAVRHNTFASLVAFGDDGVRLIQIDGRGATAAESRLALVDAETGLEEVRGVTAAVAGDLEADGDLDLVLATKTEGIRLFANRGNRTFFEVTASGAFAVDEPAAAMAIADLDRDLDLDIITVHPESGRVGMLENLLHLQFRGRFLEEIPPIDQASSIFVEDIDGNVSWDLVIGGQAGAAIVFSHTADAGAWTVDRVEKTHQPSVNLVVADLDNDSWMEVVSAGADETKFSRIGPWGFGAWQPVENVAGWRALVARQFDQTKTIDIAGINAGQAGVLINGCKTLGHYVDIRFKGIDDNASGRVNHYAIGSVLELRFGPHYRARIVTSPSTHFGVDGYQSANSVRAILPNGLTQVIADPAIDTVVEEEQTLKGSCPYLYAWDGEKYVFLTDCLWAAPLGLQVASGVVAKDRPWEYLKLDGSEVRPRGDHYEFRITEELWEVAYFDQLALTAVDHPADVEIWTNEKVGPEEIASPVIFAFAEDELHPLASAADTKGRDVTEQLAHADRDFVQGFDYRLRQGLCEPHWIDLDFGEVLMRNDRVGHGDSVYLVLTGWILPTDTSLNIQIDQNPQLGPIEFPSVWVPDQSQPSGWRKAIPFMGFPGGKTKTIVVDVTDVWVEADPRFRIRTSAQIYWDSAQIAVQSEPAAYRTSEVELLAGEVGFHGFSAPIRIDPTIPESYDYQQASEASRWPPLRGRLTRFGDCTELIRQWDDAMVVISSGDEIRVEFALPEEDPPPGWTRDFVLHCVGWDKDADLNTLSGQTIGPLPYREMTQYPPAAGDDTKTKQLERLNGHHLLRTQSFRSFWHREGAGQASRFHNVPPERP